MHGGGVNKLKMGVQILELFQGADLVLPTKIWHFPRPTFTRWRVWLTYYNAHYVARKKKTIKHNRGVVPSFRIHLSPKLSYLKEGSHNFYIWLRVNRGAPFDLFVYVVYVALVGSKHESESLFQNIAANIAKVQTLGGIVLLGRDFNVRTTMLFNTIDTSDLCELL
jgi:hypothetical protein